MKIIISILTLLSFINSQDLWSDGNMRDIKNFYVNVFVVGLEGTLSEDWVKSKIINNLEEYRISTSEEFVYPQLRLLVVGKPMNEVPSTYYTIEFSVFHYSVSIEEYSDSFTYDEEIKKFRTSKIYEEQSIGYSNNTDLRERLLSAIDDHFQLFIRQWFADNPRHQF